MKTPHTVTVGQILADDTYHTYASSVEPGLAKTLEGQVGGTKWRVTRTHTAGALGGTTEVVCEGTIEDCVEAYNQLD